jgi:hypothetical protein
VPVHNLDLEVHEDYFLAQLGEVPGEPHCIDNHLDGLPVCGTNGGVWIVNSDAKAIINEPTQ